MRQTGKVQDMKSYSRTWEDQEGKSWKDPYEEKNSEEDPFEEHRTFRAVLFNLYLGSNPNSRKKAPANLKY